MQTTLRRINEIDPTEFGVDLLEYQMLMRASDNGEQVTVLAMVLHGDTPERSYYDVQLSNGLKVDALSGHHLNNIDAFSDSTATIVHCQLVVDVQYIRTNKQTINHDALENYLLDAINEKLTIATGITEMKLNAVEVTFETEFEMDR